MRTVLHWLHLEAYANEAVLAKYLASMQRRINVCCTQPTGWAALTGGSQMYLCGPASLHACQVETAPLV
jgi:hypothetical protein